MKTKLPERELGGGWADVFNLAGEAGVDPVRLQKEREEQDRRDFEAYQYQQRMQKTFAEVPGYVGGDIPRSAGSKGRVIVEPGQINEAVKWLKRRFHVNENLELSTDLGLCVEVVSRVRKGTVTKVCHGKLFAKPEQLQFKDL